MLRALLLTLAVEVPLYTAALTLLRLTVLWRAAALGMLVNLLTHPALWLFLSPHPSAARLWSAEALATAVEAAVVLATLRPPPRERLLPAVIAVGANAGSLLMGLLVLS